MFPAFWGKIPYSNDCFLRVLTQMPNEWRRRGLLHFPVIAWSCGVQTQGQLVGKCPTLASCSGSKFPKVAHCFRCLMVSMCPMEIFPSSEQSDRTAIAIRSTCNCRSVDLQLPFGLLAIAIRSTCNCRSVYWQLPFDDFHRGLVGLSRVGRWQLRFARFSTLMSANWPLMIVNVFFVGYGAPCPLMVFPQRSCGNGR